MSAQPLPGVCHPLWCWELEFWCPLPASRSYLGWSPCPVMELQTSCGVTRRDGWDEAAEALLFPSHKHTGEDVCRTESQLTPLRGFQKTVTLPGVVPPFCHELASYFKVENVFDFELQPLDVTFSLSARWDCVPCPFGISAKCECPLQ